MKKSLFSYILLSAFAGFMSCTDDTIPVEREQGIRDLMVTGKDFIEAYPESRTTVEITQKGASFKWSDNDTIGIFPEEGAQAYFLMQQNSGKTATFTGGGWALKSNSMYGAYYPFIADINLVRTNIPVDYSQQVQKGNASTAHLCKCDYMVASPSSPVNGTVSLHFEHMGCLFHFNTKTLPSVKLEKVAITTKGKDLPVKGILDIDKGIIEVDENTKVSTITLECEDVFTTDQSGELTVNLMMPPFDLTGKTFYLNLEFSDQSKSQIEIKGDKYEAGKAYNLTSEALKHDQVLVVEHSATEFKIPTFTGTAISGKIYWGDYSEEVFDVDKTHQYTDGLTNHSVTIGVKNAKKVTFSSIENISCIDFTKM